MVLGLYKHLLKDTLSLSDEESHRLEREREQWPEQMRQRAREERERAEQAPPAERPIDDQDPFFGPRMAAIMKFAWEADNERMGGGVPWPGGPAQSSPRIREGIRKLAECLRQERARREAEERFRFDGAQQFIDGGAPVADEVH